MGKMTTDERRKYDPNRIPLAVKKHCGSRRRLKEAAEALWLSQQMLRDGIKTKAFKCDHCQQWHVIRDEEKEVVK